MNNKFRSFNYLKPNPLISVLKFQGTLPPKTGSGGPPAQKKSLFLKAGVGGSQNSTNSAVTAALSVKSGNGTVSGGSNGTVSGGSNGPASGGSGTGSTSNSAGSAQSTDYSESILMVSVYYEDTRYTFIEDVQALDILTLLGVIGGQFGYNQLFLFNKKF